MQVLRVVVFQAFLLLVPKKECEIWFIPNFAHPELVSSGPIKTRQKNRESYLLIRRQMVVRGHGQMGCPSGLSTWTSAISNLFKQLAMVSKIINNYVRR